jgi:hypothetical protein
VPRAVARAAACGAAFLAVTTHAGCLPATSSPKDPAGRGQWRSTPSPASSSSVSTTSSPALPTRDTTTISSGEGVEPDAPLGAITGARPGQGRRVDIALRGASLQDALRFFADAGHFSLVVEGSLGGVVDVELVDVDPYEALVLVAQAKGASVSVQAGTVVVTSP